MRRIPGQPTLHKISCRMTPEEIMFIEKLRRTPDRYAEVVTHAERNLIAMIRSGKADMAASTARELANMARDYAAYEARCDEDEALGYRPAS